MPSTEAFPFCNLLCGIPESHSEAGRTGAQQDGRASSLLSGLSPIGLTLPPYILVGLQVTNRRVAVWRKGRCPVCLAARSTFYL